MCCLQAASDVTEHEWLEHARIAVGTRATPDMVAAAEATVASTKWVTLVERSALRPGVDETRHNVFKSSCPDQVFTHIRVNYHPDGGVARLRAFGEPRPDFARMAAVAASAGVLADLSSQRNGGASPPYLHFRGLSNPVFIRAHEF